MFERIWVDLPGPFRPGMIQVVRRSGPGPFINWCLFRVWDVLMPQGMPKELRKYWIRPDDGANAPQSYLDGEAKSSFVVRVVDGYVGRLYPNANVRSARILEPAAM